MNKIMRMILGPDLSNGEKRLKINKVVTRRRKYSETYTNSTSGGAVDPSVVKSSRKAE